MDTKQGDYTARKEIKCSEDSEILHEIVRDTTRNMFFPDFREVSRTISCCISESRYNSFPF